MIFDGGALSTLLGTLLGNSLSRDQQIAKLRPVVETAEEVWGTQ